MSAEHTFTEGDFRVFPPPDNTTLIIADPLYDKIQDYLDIISFDLPTILFMRPRMLRHLPAPLDLAFWLKPISTKNTLRSYSCFIEVIAFYRTNMNADLHWSNRTGIFTDYIMFKNHAFKKPDSLIERLIHNHYSGHGIVYDPCAGSKTVEDVCKRLSISSYSVDIGGSV